jgi:3-hydroxyacyl-[acyl-carrier-protein] dehydratase
MLRVGLFELPPDHPCLPGHFPGHPLVPGVLVLDAALRAIADSLPGFRVAGLPAVKFLGPVLPGEAVEICRAAPVRGRVQFECRRAGAVALRGTALLAEAA